MEYQLLVEKALSAKAMAYVPYSNFRVGAAVLLADNEIYSGCNVENASYGATVCAERVAVFKAISHSRQNIQAIAIASDTAEEIFPCGICCQVLIEFNPDMKVIVSNKNGMHTVHKLSDLWTHYFTKSSLKK